LSKRLLEGRFPPKCTIEVSVDPVRAPGQFDFQWLNTRRDATSRASSACTAVTDPPCGLGHNGA